MKTIDEIIAGYENCYCLNGKTCDECPYAEECGSSSMNPWRDDVLRCLREYRAQKDHVAYVESIRVQFEEARDRHLKALGELKGSAGKWNDISRGKLPEKEGQYLTFCKYRNGSTAVKVKLWKNYCFTSENVNVFYWMELPADPEA